MDYEIMFDTMEYADASNSGSSMLTMLPVTEAASAPLFESFGPEGGEYPSPYDSPTSATGVSYSNDDLFDAFNDDPLSQQQQQPQRQGQQQQVVDTMKWEPMATKELYTEEVLDSVDEATKPEPTEDLFFLYGIRGQWETVKDIVYPSTTDAAAGVPAPSNKFTITGRQLKRLAALTAGALRTRQGIFAMELLRVVAARLKMETFISKIMNTRVPDEGYSVPRSADPSVEVVERKFFALPKGARTVFDYFCVDGSRIKCQPEIFHELVENHDCTPSPCLVLYAGMHATMSSIRCYCRNLLIETRMNPESNLLNDDGSGLSDFYSIIVNVLRVACFHCDLPLWIMATSFLTSRERGFLFTSELTEILQGDANGTSPLARYIAAKVEDKWRTVLLREILNLHKAASLRLMQLSIEPIGPILKPRVRSTPVQQQQQQQQTNVVAPLHSTPKKSKRVKGKGRTKVRRDSLTKVIKQVDLKKVK